MEDRELYAILLGIKAPWNVTKVLVDMERERIDVWAEEIAGARFPCAECSAEESVYDHTEEQTWRHLNTCQYKTFLHVRLPRTNCPVHGAKQILAPWAEPRAPFTRLYEGQLINVLKECDVTGGTRLTDTSWDELWGVMNRAVARGLARKEKRVPEHIGIDEKSVGKGQDYESIVCDIDKGTVEYVIDDRTKESLESYWKQFTQEELKGVKAIAMDMWVPYIAADKDVAVMEAIRCIPDEGWAPYKTRDGVTTDREIAETVHTMNKGKISFRLVVLRWRDKQPDLFGSKYNYHCIAAEMEEESSEEVVWEYNGRVHIENHIKEVKGGFGMEHIPTGDFGANAVYFGVGILTYNLFLAQRMLTMPEEWKTKTIKSIRWIFVEVGGKLIRHGRETILKIATSLEKYRIYLEMRRRTYELISV